MYGLIQEFPNLKVFAFHNPDIDEGIKIIGKDKTIEIVGRLIMRPSFSLNPFYHLLVIIRLLTKIDKAIRVFNDCRAKGLSVYHSYSQLYYNHPILLQSFDIVHINALQTSYHFKCNSVFGEAKVLISVRGQDIDFFPDKYDSQLNWANSIHVIGEYLRERVKSRNILDKKITTIPPAHPIEDITENHKSILDKSEFNIATAARLFWTKGHKYSIDVVEELIKKGYNIKYHIYGDGEESEELLFLVKSKRLEKVVIFHNWISELDLIKALKNMDLYLLLSIEEGFNNSVLLAKALGIPCIVSNAGGLSENVLNAKTGYVINKYSSDEAVEMISQLINSNELYTELSKNAIERSKSLSIKSQVDSFTKLYNDMSALKA